VAMRPPIPSINLSRRAKIALWVVAILIVLIIALVQLTGVYINWLWFGSVGFRSVYVTIFWTRVTLFFIFGVLMALIIGGNLVVAYLLSPPFRPMSPEQQNIERYRAILEPRRFLVLAAISVIALFSAGASAQGNWSTWQLFLHGGSFGVKDPQFHRDVSFYAWDYPAYRLMLGFGFTAIIFAIILSTVVHYLSGAIRLQTPGPKVTPAARRHLTVLVFVFVVLKAIAYWLDRYGLVFSNRSTFTGASYTDVHAVLPARTILFWIAIVIAAGLIASLWLRSTLLPGIAFVSMLVLSILISGIYPAILQQVSVKPNASSKEAPYIKRNISATRTAYNIVTKDGKDPNGTVTYDNHYPSLTSPSTDALVETNPTVSNIRILDPNQLTRTFTQQQQIRNVYGFADKLDVDRYTVANAETGTKAISDYIVGVRELDAANLSGTQANWINQHTVFTHGYGFVAAAANENVTNGKTPYAEGDIPETGPLSPQLKHPEAYFGELLPDYSIVGASGSPQEYNETGNTKITYGGTGGVSLSNVFTRLAFAVNYKQTNFLLNDAASAKGAKIIFDRDPRQRVAKVAPYLTVDGDPYPFVDSTTGDIQWMVDAYTTMSNFPYSQRNSLASLTADSLSTTGKTAGQANSQINYIRNSVKATVDAYTGDVKLYAWDPTDPVLNAWRAIFPGTVLPKSAMPSSVLAHVRYPEDLFNVQRSLIGNYHVDNPVKFYNVGDRWTVPNDPNEPGNQPPYYVLASQPGKGSTAPQFQLTTPMIVNGKQNLAAYLSVSCDPATWGQMTVLRVPSTNVTLGPEQIANILKTNTTISQNLTLLSGAGSSIIDGNLLTLPIGNSFLYVEPLYVQGTAGAGTYPVLQRVLVVYGDQIGFEPTLQQALTDLEPDHTTGESLPPTSGGGGGPTGPTSTPTPTTPPPSSSSSSSNSTSPPPQTGGKVTLAQVQQAYADLNAALASGNQRTYLLAQLKFNQVVAKYLAAHPGALPTSSSSSSAPSSPHPSGTG
jgi:uncharacterized membrane protein (UPF0182 family)